jgi:hypothetical protein
LSNSLDKICSASNALIVVKPCKDAFKCANTGLRAIFYDKKKIKSILRYYIISKYQK